MLVARAVRSLVVLDASNWCEQTRAPVNLDACIVFDVWYEPKSCVRSMIIVTPEHVIEAVCGTDYLPLPVGWIRRIGSGILSFAIICKMRGIASAWNGLGTRFQTDCIAQRAMLEWILKWFDYGDLLKGAISWVVHLKFHNFQLGRGKLSRGTEVLKEFRGLSSDMPATVILGLAMTLLRPPLGGRSLLTKRSWHVSCKMRRNSQPYNVRPFFGG